MKFWILSLFCFSLITTTAFSADNQQTSRMQSSSEEFKEFSEAMQGRWMSEIIWITD